MKSRILFLSFCLLAIATVGANAQGGFQRRPVEERVKAVMEKLTDLKLDKAKTDLVDSIFTQAYKAQDAKINEFRTSSEAGEQREAMRTEMQKINDERDVKLKKVLTEDQYKKWKDEIEPTTRRQRGGNGNN
jgi:hypothetical protein